MGRGQPSMHGEHTRFGSKTHNHQHQYKQYHSRMLYLLRFCLYLTPLGLSIASECAKRMEATDIAAYKNLTEEELKMLRVLLEKVEF